MIAIVNKIIDNFVKKHDSYQILKGDVEYLKLKVQDLTKIVDEKEQIIEYFKSQVVEINKLIKKLDARNTAVKALKKVLKETY